MSLHDDCLTIFHAYPRLVARGAALRAIAKALKAVPFAELLEAVREYARAREGQERQYTPHCSTWMNQERYADDREEWWPAGPALPAAAAWEMVRSAVRSHGIRGVSEAMASLPDEVETAAREMGWSRLCDMTNSEMVFGRFKQIYEQSAGRSDLRN